VGDPDRAGGSPVALYHAAMGRQFMVLVIAALVMAGGCQDGGTAAEAPSPSVVVEPTTDPTVLLGMYALSTGRPPVVDGDTVRVEGLDNTLRLLGLDTEETFKDKGRKTLAEKDWAEYVKTMNAGRPKGRPAKYGTPMGDAGKRFAEAWFAGMTQVRLEYDDPERTRGYFGRHLVYVLAEKDGALMNYNVEAVRMGYSPYFTKYGRSKRYHAAFVAAEKEAREAKRGIWGAPPAHKCYPDYDTLITWWNERDAAIQKVEALRRTRDLYVLGIDAEWERLIAADGKVVTVVGSPGDFRDTGALGIQYVGHRNRLDFAVVGPKEQFEGHELGKHPGDMLLITGKVTLYRGRPQFRLEEVRVETLR